jgi:DNA-binding NtrC family response regulator
MPRDGWADKGAAPSGGVSAAVETERLALLLDSVHRLVTRALATARSVAPFEMPVLLVGETGTGKSALAAAIHRWSRHHDGPFVTVSHRAPDETARTPRGGTIAHASSAERQWSRLAPGGTLFIDEVAAVSRPAQAALARFLEDADGTPRADVRRSTRLVSATSRDLERDVQAGRFRRDLFYRLNAVTIALPALRERRGDLPTLTRTIVANLCARHQRPRVELAPEVHAALRAYEWRGNLRELEMVLEHAIVLARTATIQLTDLPKQLWGRD